MINRTVKNSRDKTAHDKQLRGLRPAWKPGQSGNPNGRPKKELCIPDILRRIGDEPFNLNSKITRLESMLRSVYRRALAGEGWAVQFIAERIDGKVTNHVDVNQQTTEQQNHFHEHNITVDLGRLEKEDLELLRAVVRKATPRKIPR